MEKTFQVFLDEINNVYYNGVFGISINEIIIFIIVVIVSLSIRGLFAKILINNLKKIVNKTINKSDDLLFHHLSGPLKLIPIIFIFIYLSFFIDNQTKFYELISNLNTSLVTIFVFWFFHSLIIIFKDTFTNLEKILSKALVSWFINALKYLIIFLGLVAVLEIWGIKIGPVIAGLGLFGVAIALGAQDLFKNLISGILILLEKRFHINDVIEIPSYGIGTVEYIGFRSTTIRMFDSTPITIPNYIIADTAILNFSLRKYRRINWLISLEYNSSVDQLKNICHDLSDYLINNKDHFIINEDYKSYVRIEKFSDSSIDVLVQVFCNTNDWGEYLDIKEELIVEIKKVVEDKNNASFAFPSQTIYVENISN